MDSWLPAEPDVFGRVVEMYGIPTRTKWLPGAFGNRFTIADVDGFKVLDAVWEWEDDAKKTMLCTIKRAEVVTKSFQTLAEPKP